MTKLSTHTKEYQQSLLSLLRNRDLQSLKQAINLNKQETIDFVLANNIRIILSPERYEGSLNTKGVLSAGVQVKNRDYSLKDVIYLENLKPIWGQYREYSLFEFGGVLIDYDSNFIKQLILNTIDDTLERKGTALENDFNMQTIFYAIMWATTVCSVKKEGYEQKELPISGYLNQCYRDELNRLSYSTLSITTWDLRIRRKCKEELETKMDTDKHGLYQDLYKFVTDFEDIRLDVLTQKRVSRVIEDRGA